ncbi:MAG: methionyl-tRNA formyltransferase [Clostridia bacterium]
MRIAFLGTPDFALPSLRMLIQRGDELCVFTQPDRPKGRHGTLTPPPVKVLAEQHGIPVYQFDKIRLPEGVEALTAFAPDLMVTAAFGQILSQENLDIPKHGCINVHGSLLPQYRGAAPIQWAVINGERVTGITTMLTDAGLDTGDILLQREVEIYENETSGELFDRMADIGARVLLDTIAALEGGTLKRMPQDSARATKCRMIKKDMAKIDFSLPHKQIHNFVRGMNPWPVAFFELDGEQVKLYSTRLTQYAGNGRIGECVSTDPKEGVFVNTGDGLLELLELQFPGAKRMDARTCAHGRSLAGRLLK